MIGGAGSVGPNTYAGGEQYHIVQIHRLLDGRIWRTTTYFAQPFAAPAWRAPFVVTIEPERS